MLFTKARGIEFDPCFAKRDIFLANPTKTISKIVLMAPPPTEGQKIKYLAHL